MQTEILDKPFDNSTRFIYNLLKLIYKQMYVHMRGMNELAYIKHIYKSIEYKSISVVMISN